MSEQINDPPILHKEIVFGYFRLGLVTGILEKKDVIAWADREILHNPDLEPETIELSLSSHLNHSQLLSLLNLFQGTSISTMPIKLILARAGIILEIHPEKLNKLLLGVRLLIAEEYLPIDIREKLVDLEKSLVNQRQGKITSNTLQQKLVDLLEPYHKYRSLTTRLG